MRDRLTDTLRAARSALWRAEQRITVHEVPSRADIAAAASAAALGAACAQEAADMLAVANAAAREHELPLAAACAASVALAQRGGG